MTWPALNREELTSRTYHANHGWDHVWFPASLICNSDISLESLMLFLKNLHPQTLEMQPLSTLLFFLVHATETPFFTTRTRKATHFGNFVELSRFLFKGNTAVFAQMNHH